MGKITYNDIILIVEEFRKFMSDVKESTQNQYVDIVKEYLLNEVRNQVEDYRDIFAEDRIIDFQQNYRRSKVVRSALKKLKDYLIVNGYLDKHFDFEYVFFGEAKKLSKEVIALEDIRNIVLGTDAFFRNHTEKIITQCMSAICYFCLFEQRHIRMLKCSDVLVNEERIRNVRIDDKSDEEGLSKWLFLGKEVLGYINEYIKYFNIDMSTDELFFRMPDGTLFDNSCQNNLFANYKFKHNNFLNVGSQNLNYSRIYHYLVATKGRGVVDILAIVGFANEQLKNAMKEYVLDYGVVYNPNSVTGLLGLEEVTLNYEKAVNMYEDSVNDEGEDESEYKPEASEKRDEGGNWVLTCKSYSEENDIKMDEVLLYDSMSENNQKSKDVELSRLVRSTYLAENLKLAYNNSCQLCGTRLMKTRFDAYSEAHHVRPYNKVHKGDDTIGNMIVLCPNCHSQFDNLYYAIHPNTKLVHCINEDDRFHLARMEFIGEHELEEKYLTYTWKLFKKK